MKIKGPTVLPFSILSLILCKFAVGNPWRAGVPGKYIKYRRTNLFSHNNQLCACFDQDPTKKSVAQILDPNNQGLLRLVVYLYKYPDGQIKIYTPNLNKQMVFPELVYETGDVIKTVTNDQIADVANNTSSINQFVKETAGAGAAGAGAAGAGTAGAGTDVKKPGANENKPSVELKDNEIDEDRNEPHPNGAEDNENEKQPQSPKFPRQEDASTINDITIPIKDNIYASDPQYASQSQNKNDFIIQVPGFPVKGTSKNTITFNQWIIEQLKNMEQDKSLKSYPIDTATLEILIKNILSKHGIKISVDGILTDSNGKNLNMTSLRLRPVLIGDSVQYDEIIPKINVTYSLPKRLPYLESLIINLSGNILGIIPISKVFLPEDLKKIYSSHSEAHLPGSAQDSLQRLEHGSTSSSSSDGFQVNLPNKPRNTESSLISKRPVGPITHIGTSKIMLEKSKHISHVPYFGPEYHGQNEEPQEHHEIVYHQDADDLSVSDLTKILNGYPSNGQLGISRVASNIDEGEGGDQKGSKILLRGLDGGDILKDRSKLYFSQKKKSSKLETGDRKPFDQEMLRKLIKFLNDELKRKQGKRGPQIFVDDLEVEEPEYRIIGGNAATGSGFPISNRGRSGNTKNSYPRP